MNAPTARLKKMLAAAALAGFVPGAFAQPADFQQLDEQAQSLKREVLQLNAELLALQEELMFPVSTQVAVFLSVDVGEFFDLESVQVQIDGKEVTNYLYTQREVDALLKGGTQRLFLGNLRSGEHELVALYRGVGPHQRQYLRGTTLKFAKDTNTRLIELRIADDPAMLRPEFQARVWE